MISKNRIGLIVSSIVIMFIISSLQTESIKSKSFIQPDNLDQTNQFSTSTKKENVEYLLTKKYSYDESLGAMNDIFIKDNLAFVAVRWGGLVIFNISNLEEPKIIGSYIEPVETISETDLTSGIFVRDDVAFVADGANGLLILNVSNPRLPFKIGQYNEQSFWRVCFRVFVEDNIAYVTTMIYLMVIDISDLTSPIKISEIDHYGFNKDIEVKNRIIFLASSTSVKILNASNPTSLEEITILDNTKAFTLQEDFLFTAAGQNNFVTYNISESSYLSIIFNYSVSIIGSVNYICTNTKYTYIGSTDEIVAINISDFTNPKNISKISNLNIFFDTNDTINIKRKLTNMDDFYKSNILVFTDYQQGLFIYNISKPAGNTLVAHYDCGKRVGLVAINGEYIYIASHAESPFYPAELGILTIVDGSVHHLGSYITNSSINDMITINEYVLLATSSNIEIIDTSNPAKPVLISKYPLGALNIFYDNDQFLYLCSGMAGLFIIDASDLNNLTLISQITTLDGYGYYAKDVIISKGIAFIADGQTFGGFGIVNISNPHNPSTIGYYPLNSIALSINIRNDLLYISTDYPQLITFDITDVNNPLKLGDFRSNSRGSDVIHFYGELLFMPQWLSGLSIIDISDSFNPHEIISVKDSLTGICVDLHINGSTIYLADAWDGLEIWECTIISLYPKWKTAVISLSSIVVVFTVITIVIILLKRNKKI